MTIEKKLEKRIKTIVQMTGEYPEQMEVTQKECIELSKENMTAQEQFLKVRGNDVYFRNVKLKIKK